MNAKLSLALFSLIFSALTACKADLKIRSKEEAIKLSPASELPAGPPADQSGVPLGSSRGERLDITIGGANVHKYKYKLGESGTVDCSSPVGYSEERMVSIKITDDLTAFADGPLRLCLIGCDAAGLCQKPQDVKPIDWTNDKTPPSPAAVLTAVSGASKITLSWLSGGGGEDGHLLVRKAGSAVTWSPSDGTTYSLGDQEGGHTIIYNGTASEALDDHLNNSTTYFYALFAFDDVKNYATGIWARARPHASSSIGPGCFYPPCNSLGGEGSGIFGLAPAVSADAYATRAIALGDFNGDQTLDLVVGNDNEPNQIFLGLGNGSFESGPELTTVPRNTRDFAVGDLNRDGMLDIVVGNANQANQIYLGNGDGTFSASSNLTPDAHDTRSVALGDVNRDNYIDVIIGNANQVNRLYLGIGDGTFQPGRDVSADANNTQAVALADLNNDDILDLAVANSNQTARVYLGIGDGSFGEGSAISADTNDSRAIALGDIDKDGALDVVTGNANQANRIYLGIGDGTFAAGNDIALDAHDTNDVALADFNGDSLLDVVAANQGQVGRVYLGQSDGSFSTGSDIASATPSARAVAVGDLNNNGSQDVIFGNEGEVSQSYFGLSALTYSADYPEAITAWSDNSQTVAAFDSANGTLVTVVIAHTGIAKNQVRVENINAQTADVNDATFTNTITSTTPQCNLPLNIVQSLVASPITLASFDGVVDFMGASGFDSGSTTETASDSCTLTSAMDLAFYTDVGAIALAQSASANATTSMDSGVASTVNSKASATVSVTYFFNAH